MSIPPFCICCAFYTIFLSFELVSKLLFSFWWWFALFKFWRILWHSAFHNTLFCWFWIAVYSQGAWQWYSCNSLSSFRVSIYCTSSNSSITLNIMLDSMIFDLVYSKLIMVKQLLLSFQAKTLHWKLLRPTPTLGLWEKVSWFSVHVCHISLIVG